MKLLLVISLVVLAAARPQDVVDTELAPVDVQPQFTSPPVEEGSSLLDAGILRMDFTQNEDGSFAYGYETTDPIQHDTAGQQKQIGESAGTVMQGSFSFTATDEDGNEIPVSITWTADENGFQAQGDAIPVAPEDPNAEAQAQAYAAAGGVPQQRDSVEVQ